MASMIPFGLLAGFIGEKEIRIIEIEESGFRFRIRRESSYAQICDEVPSNLFSVTYQRPVRICFYNIEKSAYEEIEITSYELEECPECTSEFYREFQVEITQKDNGAGECEQEKCKQEKGKRKKYEQENYAQAVRRLLGQYSRYIRLKLEDDDSFLAQNMTGYPGEKDVIKCRSLEEQAQIWKKEKEDIEQAKEIEKAKELAVELDRSELYQAYLKKPLEKFRSDVADQYSDFYKKNVDQHLDFYKENVDQHPDFCKKIERLYIGNQFCPLLFPEKKILFRMLEKAYEEQVKITISFSYMREYTIDSVRTLLQELDAWCEKKGTAIEVVVNDWGMASMVKNETKNLISCMGILLNKRKKDPRISYKKGDKKLFQTNNLNAEFYREFLKKEFHFQRFEWESCGYEQRLPEEKNSLHLPFYQTNTSQYCPLRAMCISGERGHQKLAKECPGYCSKYVFLYPEHLHMVGRYNSLFGIDMDILKEKGILENYIKNGVDRLVYSLL